MINSFYGIWGEIIDLQDRKLVQKVYISKTEIGKVGSRLLSKVRFCFVFYFTISQNYNIFKSHQFTYEKIFLYNHLTSIVIENFL
jgi:hypothetical protein